MANPTVLVAQEYLVSEETLNEFPRMWKVNDKYTWFIDPETGKVYRPKAGFTVTGDDLGDLFCEVKIEPSDDDAAAQGG